MLKRAASIGTAPTRAVNTAAEAGQLRKPALRVAKGDDILKMYQVVEINSADDKDKPFHASYRKLYRVPKGEVLQRDRREKQ